MREKESCEKHKKKRRQSFECQNIYQIQSKSTQFHRRRIYIGYAPSKDLDILYLTASLFLLVHLCFSHLDTHSRRLYMSLSLCPHCLFTSRLFYFCRANPRVRHLFCSNSCTLFPSVDLVTNVRLECVWKVHAHVWDRKRT